MKNFILFGLKNSGKTTLGTLLAKHLNCFFIDTDHLIEKTFLKETGQKLSYKKIYQNYQEPFFRALEKRAVLSLKGITNSLIALGGGSLLDPSLQEFIPSLGTLIYLKISKETFLKRAFLLKKSSSFKEEEKKVLEQIYFQRTKIFEKLPSKIIETENLSTAQIIEEFFHGLK